MKQLTLMTGLKFKMIINLSLEEILFFIDFHNISMAKTTSTNKVQGIVSNFQKEIYLEPHIIHSFLNKFEEAHDQKKEQLVIQIQYKQEPFLSFRAEFKKNDNIYSLFMRQIPLYIYTSDDDSIHISTEEIKEKIQCYLNIEKEKASLENLLNSNENPTTIKI